MAKVIDNLNIVYNSLKVAYDLGCERFDLDTEIYMIDSMKNGDALKETAPRKLRITQIDQDYKTLGLLQQMAFNLGCGSEF